MSNESPVARSVRIFAALAALCAFGLASAQSAPIVLSIDRYLTHSSSGENRHEVLPVAVFDGTRFRPVWEWDRVLGQSTRAPYLLNRYPNIHVLQYGKRIGTISVSSTRMQPIQCSSLFIGEGDYLSSNPIPTSEYSSVIRRNYNGERADFMAESFLALSGELDETGLDGAPVIVPVTDAAQLQAYATDLERIAPRRDLLPLGIDQIRVYTFSGRDDALVIRKRQTAGTVAGPGDIRLPGTIYTDVAIVREGPGQRAVFPLEGFPTSRNGLGGGSLDYFIDAFSLDNGMTYFSFERQHSEATNFRLYQLGASTGARLVLEVVLHGC